MKKFELWFGCLGNGTTVCNKAVEENGDYKVIAHISNAGNIRWRVKESYVPAEDMKRIEEMVARDKANFKKEFEKFPMRTQYARIIDAVPFDKFMEFVDDKRPLEEKLQTMREYYYTIA